MLPAFPSLPIPNISSPIRLVGLGMACLDVLIRTEELPTWEQGALLETLAVDGGGPAATGVVAAQKLGVQAGFIGTYGSDRLGQIKLQTLVDQGVDVSRAVRMDGPENQTVLVCVNSRTGERVFSGTAGWHDRPLEVAELDWGYITAAEVLLLDGYHCEAALTAARWMKAAGRLVMLDGAATSDPIPEDMCALVAETDILICGSGFGPALAGRRDVREAGARILKMGPGLVVQTEGKDGSFTTTRSECFHTPAFEVDVVDTTGAGDVFHGAYIAGLLRGWDARTNALFSSAAAAINCTRLGGRQGIPTFDEVMNFLHERGVNF